MGQISIGVQGSFKPNEHGTFSAQKNGHADAVAKAIQWLSDAITSYTTRE